MGVDDERSVVGELAGHCVVDARLAVNVGVSGANLIIVIVIVIATATVYSKMREKG